MTNDQFRLILYAINRQCDERRTPVEWRLTNIRAEVDNALTVLSRETDTALTAEPVRNREANGDCIYA